MPHDVFEAVSNSLKGKRMFRKAIFGSICGVSVFAMGSLAAADVVVPMNMIDANGVTAPLGKVTLKESKRGSLLLDLDFTNVLPWGVHGFHVHQNGDCGPGMKDGKAVAGLAAGGHYDPDNTGKHEGPSGAGHKGDLPAIYVEIDEDGFQPVTHTLVAPRLKIADLLGRALVIHEDGDNYRDAPAALGGGGARVACGVVPETAD
jgi:Cu-Zn family superoxide dismutase